MSVAHDFLLSKKEAAASVFHGHTETGQVIEVYASRSKCRHAGSFMNMKAREPASVAFWTATETLKGTPLQTPMYLTCIV